MKCRLVSFPLLPFYNWKQLPIPIIQENGSLQACCVREKRDIFALAGVQTSVV